MNILIYDWSENPNSIIDISEIDRLCADFAEHKIWFFSNRYLPYNQHKCIEFVIDRNSKSERTFKINSYNLLHHMLRLEGGECVALMRFGLEIGRGLMSVLNKAELNMSGESATVNLYAHVSDSDVSVDFLVASKWFVNRIVPSITSGESLSTQLFNWITRVPLGNTIRSV